MGNLWSKRPLAPDCFNSPNPKKRKSTIFDSPVLQQRQPDNEAPPTMDYEEAAKTPYVLRFSDGLDLANLAVSSDVLSNSWAAISELQSQINRNHQSPPSSDTVKIREFEHSKYKIIAFVTLPVATTYLQEQSGLVPSSSSEASEFKFLCSKKNPSFSINKAAISLFNSLKDQLSPLKAQVATSSKSIPHIITGDCLGGSIASLFTLWLLRTLDLATAKRPLCITFGSPLIGNTGFQQAISQYSSWNTCFLHVAHKDDGFPKLFQSSIMEQSIYKPFGTFLVCSESGGACFEAPESIIELLAPKHLERAQTFNYKSIIKCLEWRLICKNHYAFSVPDTDSFKVGITAQVAAIGLMPIQPQNMDIDALLGKIVMSEHDVLEGKNQVFDPAEELNTMKAKLANLEWYKKTCEDKGPRSGYYDSFKNKMAPRDHTAVKFIKPLTNYWESVVEEAEKRPQRVGALMRIRWLFAGTNYRRMVEPLHIAEYYKWGKRSYISQGRSKHFKLLEQWLDEHQKQPKNSVPNKSKMKKIMFSITEDSCFWAHVEEARISCRLLKTGGSNSAEIEKLVEFEKYVMGLLENYAVSPDIFLEGSSYMQWWREYKDILRKQMRPQPFTIPLRSLTSFRTLEGAFKGQTQQGIKEVKRYLWAFGYLDYEDGNDAVLMDDWFDETLESALKSYQRFCGLKVTGKLDADTVEQMSVPRCGVADPVHSRHAKKNATKPSKFHTVAGCSFFAEEPPPRWSSTQTHLTYTFSSLVDGVSLEELRGACERAFLRWADVSPFTFGEPSSVEPPNIAIGFYRGDHGDGYPFNGSTFAYAKFAPPNGEFHYDAEWQWSTNPSPTQCDLETVALHEIGHLLGLHHSKDPKAIMYAGISPGGIKRDLQQDDIDGIHALYPKQ